MKYRTSLEVLPSTSRVDSTIPTLVSPAHSSRSRNQSIFEVTQYRLFSRRPWSFSTLSVYLCGTVSKRSAVVAHSELLLEELNVKRVVALGDDAALASLSFKANFKTMGKRMGPKMKEAAAEVAAFTREQWNVLEQGGAIEVQGQQVMKEDVLVSRTARGEVVIESEGDLTVALDTTMTEVLAREGLMRELVSRVQRQRKDLGLEVSDRIGLEVATTSESLKLMLQEHDAKIREEVLAVIVTVVETSSGEVMDLDGHAITVQVGRAAS